LEIKQINNFRQLSGFRRGLRCQGCDGLLICGRSHGLHKKNSFICVFD
jgi:hypothetical protein